jgi:hypothetical protein
MTNDVQSISALDKAEYLYLRKISEPIDNSLLIVIDQAVAGRPAALKPKEMPGLDALRQGARAIETTPECLKFQLFWKRYVAYLITQESKGSCGKYDDEEYTGRFFRRYSKSHFLAHLSKDTGAHFEPFHHYKLICLNHLIDVAAAEPPKIEVTQAPLALAM